MKASLTLIALLCLLSCTKESHSVNDLPIMGNLELGAHHVGFKSLFLYDPSRPGIPYSDWDGKLYRDQEAYTRYKKVLALLEAGNDSALNQEEKAEIREHSLEALSVL